MESPKTKLIAKNRKAYHEFQILERYEAGIVLQGTEVKALREGKANLKDSYAEIREGEVYLVKTHIGHYSAGNMFNHEPERVRKLLLHRREIRKLFSRVAERGLTIVPLSIYFKSGRAKVEIALARGKKIYDRRRDIEERERKREMAREFREKERWGS